MPVDTFSRPSFSVLWRALLVSPIGQPEWVELRAPSEQMALDRLAHWRPDWTVTAITRRPTGA